MTCNRKNKAQETYILKEIRLKSYCQYYNTKNVIRYSTTNSMNKEMIRDVARRNDNLVIIKLNKMIS